MIIGTDMDLVKLAIMAAAFAMCIADSAPSLAQPADRNPNSPGLGWGPPQSRGAPGPVAAAGLPFLIGAGAFGVYKLIRGRLTDDSRASGGSES